MSDQECVFCKIVAGEIPSHKLYENDSFIAILDVFPQGRGHTLIIPRRHNVNIFDLDDSDAAEVMQFTKKMAIAIDRSLAPHGLNLKQNNGKIAGQTVMHYHMHLIPRYEGVTADSKDFQKIAELIKAGL